MVPFLAAGFYLLAPVIGLGLYQMSAHLERNEPLRFCHFLEAWKQNQGQLGVITAGLLIIMQLWMMSNFVLFALLYTACIRRWRTSSAPSFCPATTTSLRSQASASVSCWLGSPMRSAPSRFRC
jgi:uncharacterized membrane protein